MTTGYDPIARQQATNAVALATQAITLAQGTSPASLATEQARATTAETLISDNLTAETARAEAAEALLAGHLTSETTRAEAAEALIAGNLTNETTRAEAAEALIATNLANEITRAKAAEAALAATSPAPAGKTTLYGTPHATFDVTVAGMTLVRDFVFGTGAVAGAGQIAITSQAALAEYFNPFEDGTGQTSVNSELERYQPFNPTNHAFAADRLNLTCVRDESTYAAPWVSAIHQNDGTTGVTPYSGGAPIPIPIENLGWPDTSGVVLGQIVIIQTLPYAWYVSAIVANTSVTLTPLGGAPLAAQLPVLGNLNVVLPYYAAVASAAAAAGAESVSFTSLPAQVATGMVMGYANAGAALCRNADYRVTVAGETVTLSTPLVGEAIAAGTVCIFGPPITSGQIWSSDQFDLMGACYAFDAHLVLPTDANGGSDTHGVSTLATYNAVAADYPWGAWPAFWLDSAADNVGNMSYKDTSEIDIMELWYGPTKGPHSYFGNNHPGYNGTSSGVNAINNVRTFWYAGGETGATTNGTGIQFPFSLAGAQRISAIITPDRTYRYINGQLVLADQFPWTSGRMAQIGLDLAMGSFADFNMTVPLSDAGFANAKLGIERLTVWKL